MYKCNNCGFECVSEKLFIQHQEWCGKTDEEGKLFTELSYKQYLRSKAKENLRQKSGKVFSEY